MVLYQIFRNWTNMIKINQDLSDNSEFDYISVVFTLLRYTDLLYTVCNSLSVDY